MTVSTTATLDAGRTGAILCTDRGSIPKHRIRLKEIVKNVSQ